jgi:hypothetical protein
MGSMEFNVLLDRCNKKIQLKTANEYAVAEETQFGDSYSNLTTAPRTHDIQRLRTVFFITANLQALKPVA